MPPLLDNAHSSAVIKHVVEVVYGSRSASESGTNKSPCHGSTEDLSRQVDWGKFRQNTGRARYWNGSHENGDWLNGSVWTPIIATSGLASSGVASSGVAGSFLRTSHLTKTRHAHLTAVALYIISTLDNKSIDACIFKFEVWCEKIWEEQRQCWGFNCLAQLVHFIRTADLAQYQELLRTLIPLMCVVGHINLVRWLSANACDL